jgi:glycosyltransferase involved in cell wall biosynthesis
MALWTRHGVKVIHFHPDARMAAQFVAPLMAAERGAGYQTELISSVWRAGHEGVVVPFDLSAPNLLGLPFVLWKISAYLRTSCPDIVLSHNTKSSLLPLLAAWFVGVRVRVYFNHGVPYVGYRGVLRCLLRLLERWNIALATHVLTVSSDMVKLLQDVSPAIKAQVINNGSASGIDLQTFLPERFSRNAWRQLHGLSDQDLVVAYVGRPERRKGFELVLRLWAEYLRDKHIKLVLCGPEPGDVLRHLGTIPANVISLGFVNNVPEVLSGSDLMILPSFHEGLSYACMEAQAAGAVVVANDISGIRCVVEEGVSGFLVPNNDLEKYAEIIRKADKNQSSLLNMQQQARASVERFSRKAFIPAYLAWLSCVLPR